ncbi:ATP-binding protein [Cupriavidus sp. BIS7]|uniref:ATP-binding protein n=1 Tax=Cupriavidus sp. BIS7 TaxID=1217718 RepID=UPI0002DD24F0|nr:ATP-binding protein [Cupriavidus sp. BIS7]
MKQSENTLEENKAEQLYVIADYRRSTFPEHEGNPLIEALPPYYCGDEPVEDFSNYPVISEIDRLKSASHRLKSLSKLRLLVESMPWHFGVMRDMYAAIWRGYESRNPVAKRREIVQRRYSLAQNTGRFIPLMDVVPTHSATLGLLGPSGIGKSSAVNRCLSFLPQVIRHPDYGITQLVWLKVECPPNGSLSELMHWILKKVGRLLDAPDLEKRITQRSSLAARMNIVGEVLESLYTGILVIDEIQNVLLDAKQRYNNIDFFMTFANRIEVPTMQIGLPSAINLYPDNMHSKRRATDAGIRLLGPCMSEEEWDLYMSEIVRYQWTEEVASRKEIEGPLREKSQKNPCISSRLFELSQAIAIEKGMKSINASLISSVADERFQLVKPLVDAIRDNRLDDVVNGSATIETMCANVSAEVARTLARVRVEEKAKHRATSQVLNDAVGILISLGKPQDQVVRKIKSLMLDHAGCDVSFLVREYLNEEGDAKSKSRGNIEQKIAEEMETDQRSLNSRRGE